MRDTRPLLDKIAFPADPARPARHLADQCRLSLQPVLLPLPRQCRTEPHRGDVGRGRRRRARFSGAAAHHDARHHRRRARAQCEFPPPGDRRAQTRRQGDGPLQSHHPGAAGPGRPRGISGGEPRRGGRVDAVLSAGQCRASARQGRVRRFDPRPEETQRARLRARSGAHRSTSSTIRKGRRCRRRRLRSKPTTSACWASSYGIVFNKLFVLANMPIQRFGTMLINKGEFDGYLQLLQDAHLDANLDGVMCRNLISVDWRGFVYDCDFNQMLDLPLARGQRARLHLSDLIDDDIKGNPIRVAGHCYGCTAGQGSSCGGALERGGGMTLSIVMPVLDEAADIARRARGAGALSRARRRADRRRRRQPRCDRRTCSPARRPRAVGAARTQRRR